jgi:energy-coupling factor transporter ATP-binding protein EcfA2
MTPLPASPGARPSQKGRGTAATLDPREAVAVVGSTGAVTALVLSGSAGSGKTTQANVISEVLREADVGHAVIDLDELSRVWPFQPATLMWDNLAMVWPNYVAVPGLQVVIMPRLLDSDTDIEALRRATPKVQLLVCELCATPETCLARVIEREPNDFWKDTLRALVTEYASRPPERRFGDFQVNTDGRSELDTAREVLSLAGIL